MNTFERMAKEDLRCDICGGPVEPVHGGGWENDRIVCLDRECGGEIVFATSTVIETESK
jgi:hypothetical protein